jgi:hypothetical protein
MPQHRNERAPPVKSRGGQLAIAAKMAARVKDASGAIKVKPVAAKAKVVKKAAGSSEGSEIDESESENSSAESSLHDIELSQKPMPTEGEAAQRRKKPDPPKIEVTFHFSIFVHSHVLI